MKPVWLVLKDQGTFYPCLCTRLDHACAQQLLVRPLSLVFFPAHVYFASRRQQLRRRRCARAAGQARASCGGTDIQLLCSCALSSHVQAANRTAGDAPQRPRG